MLKELLWQNRNKWLLRGAALGTLIGMFLLLFSLQIFLDIRSVLYGDETSNYIIVNKKVNLLNSVGIKNEFKPEEIENLKSQSFIKEVGSFQSNLFQVGASSPALGFYTELFFEAVPDEFLDVEPSNWSWDESKTEIPIILSRDYLALYNFGFAPSQGLPQFTQGTIQRVRFDIVIKGMSMQKVFQGRIVGFSDRINSILVPMDFLTWANKKFGFYNEKPPSRLIINAESPYSATFTDFMKKNAYEVSRGKVIGGKVASLINGTTTLIAVIGMLIVFLAFLVFALNFRLLIAQSASKIVLLKQLGYKVDQISKVLISAINKQFIPIIIASIVLVFVVHYFVALLFKNQGFEISSMLHILVLLLALLLGLGFIFINKKIIKTQIETL